MLLIHARNHITRVDVNRRFRTRDDDLSVTRILLTVLAKDSLDRWNWLLKVWQPKRVRRGRCFAILIRTWGWGFPWESDQNQELVEPDHGSSPDDQIEQNELVDYYCQMKPKTNRLDINSMLWWELNPLLIDCTKQVKLLFPLECGFTSLLPFMQMELSGGSRFSSFWDQQSMTILSFQIGLNREVPIQFVELLLPFHSHSLSYSF